MPRFAFKMWMPVLGLCLVLAPLRLFAVDCLPDAITLTTQAEVDDFQANHGPCDTVRTGLTIDGAGITDLTPLSGLTAIATVGPWYPTHQLKITNTSLTSLAGLENIVDIFRLDLIDNPSLASLAALANLDTVRGPISIEGNPVLTNLDGLDSVTALTGGALILRGNPNLSDLGGVSGITSILGSLVISDNDGLLNLDGLSGLTMVGSTISISYNAALTSISGLSNVSGFDDSIDIRQNPLLASLDGLGGMTHLEGLNLQFNNSLTDLDNFAGVTTIGTRVIELHIRGHPRLTNLDGLSSLVSVDAGVGITDNPLLADCEALATLLDQTDDAAPGPGPGEAGIPDVRKHVELDGNAEGCNSVMDITGESIPPDFELLPTIGGLDSHVGVRATSGPDQTCGWPPGDTVEFHWDQPDVFLDQFTVGENGCFEGLLHLVGSEQLASSLPGSHVVAAIASTGPKASNPFEQVEQQLILMPPTGPPELEINVSGCGWDAGADIDLVWVADNLHLTTIVADGGGCFDDPLRLPREKNGIYPISANSNTGQESGSAFHMVGATLFLTPAEGPPNSRVPLAGCNWFPDEVIEFAFQNDQVVFDTWGSNPSGCTHNSMGPTEPTLHIPPDATLGDRIIQVTGLTSSQEVNVPFTVLESTLEFDPPSALIGDSVAVSGCGWVGNETVKIKWAHHDHNNQPIEWRVTVDADTGCFGLAGDEQITVPTDSITGELEITAMGNESGDATGLFTVMHEGYFELPDPNSYVGHSVTMNFRDMIIHEQITVQWSGNPATQLNVTARASEFSFDFPVPNSVGLGSSPLFAWGTKGFSHSEDVNIVDLSEISVDRPDDVRRGKSLRIEGRNFSSTERVSLDLFQGGFNVWGGPTVVVPSGTTAFTHFWTVPDGVELGDYVLRAEGSQGFTQRMAEIPITITSGPPSAFSLAADSDNTPPNLDGVLSTGEWDYEQKFEFEGGFISVKSDDTRLYVLLDILDDTDEDSPGQDNFWLSFDLWDNGVIDAGSDLNFRLDNSGDLILEEYAGPGAFNSRNSTDLRSAYAAGFGCFAADGSAELTFDGFTSVFTCDAHRVWEIGIDLESIQAEPGDIVRMGFRSHSASPSSTVDSPPDFQNDFSNLGAITLAPSELGADPPNGMVTGIGSNGFEIEVTQAIQDADNSLKLVADKATAVRIYPEVADESMVRVFLFGRRNGLDLPGSPMADVFRIPAAIDRSLSLDTANFRLPDSWVTQGITRLTVMVENLGGQNTEVMAQSFTFHEQRIPTYWLVLINTAKLEDPPVLLSEANIANHQSLLETVFPIPDVDWVRQPWQKLGPNMPADRDGILRRLATYYDDIAAAHATSVQNTGQEPYTMPEQIYGLRPGGGGRALTMRGGGRGLVATGGGSSTTIMAHEINHNLDPVVPGSWGKHTTDPIHEDEPPPPDNDDWGCGATQPNGIWPRTNDEINEVGFDTRMPWWAAGLGPRTAIPATYPDYMSYCDSEDEDDALDGQVPERWVSPHRWKFQFIHFTPPPPRPAAPAGLPGDVYYVSGQLHDDGSGSLDPVRTLPGIPTALIPAGEYSIEIQDAGGGVLSATPFLVAFVGSEGDPVDTVYFHYLLPHQEDGAKVVLKHGDTVLDLIEASANPPTLQVTTPAGGEEWDGEETIRWTSEDLDGDTLSFTIQYSPDGGMNWFPVASGLEGDEYLADFSLLPGGLQGRMRVIASDGFHSVAADSAGAFTVAEPMPLVYIESPVESTLYRSSQPVPLIGSTHFPGGNDSALDYVWYVDGVPAAYGLEAELWLENGSYQILFAVITEDGASGFNLVPITVDENEPPHEPIQPIPADGATAVSAGTVPSWVGGDVDGDEVTYDVYLEAGNPEPSQLVCDNSPVSICAPPGGLAPLTSYFWRVIARDSLGQTVAGDTWQFETSDHNPEVIIYADGFE